MKKRFHVISNAFQSKNFGVGAVLYFGGVAIGRFVQRSRQASTLQVRHGYAVGAHRCVRPWAKAACTQRADTSVGPYRGSKVDLCFGGVAGVWFVQRAGHAPPLQNERSVTWRSDLFILVTFTHKNMRIPGPGPQARCGKGEGSGEGLGDRCRVPRSFGPSGAGREPLK